MDANDDTPKQDGPDGLWAGRPDGGDAAEDGAQDAAPTKVCPMCSVAEQTRGTFCSHCGTPYDRTVTTRRRRRPSRRVILLLSAVVIVLAGGGVAAAMIQQHKKDAKADRAHEVLVRQRAEQRHRAAVEQAAADRAERAARRAKQAEDAARRSIRRSLVTDLRKAITKDARGRVDDGYLDGPIYGTQCDPVGGGNASDLDARTGRYSCLAYNKKKDDGTIEGYGFTATINFEKFSYQWHLGNQ